MGELRKDALGFVHSVALAVAGSAPSFSISATLTTLFAAVGILAPASLVYCGLIMLGITLAYRHLNAEAPNAGAAYSWGSAIIGRVPGFFAGWALLVSSVLFMVSATLPAGAATLILVAPQLASSQTAVTACAAGWLILVTMIVVRGITLSGRVQAVMTAIELVIIAALALAALIKFLPGGLHAVSLHDLSPFAFSPSGFASGAMIALFIFWGWDVSLNVSEETKEPDRLPGFGAVGGMIILVVIFAGLATVILLTLSDREINASVTNVVFAAADKLFPRPWSYLAILALLLSTVGTVQTQMLQFSRTMFAQARDGSLHPRWSRVHRFWQTPYLSTLLISGLGLLLLFASLGSRNIAEVMRESINAIGVLAAYYYGIAGIACAFRYRHELRGSWRRAIGKVIWPALSAAALFWAAIVTMASFDAVTTVITVGSMMLGIIPLRRNRPAQGWSAAEVVNPLPPATPARPASVSPSGSPRRI